MNVNIKVLAINQKTVKIKIFLRKSPRRGVILSRFLIACMLMNFNEWTMVDVLKKINPHNPKIAISNRRKIIFDILDASHVRNLNVLQIYE